MTVDTTIIQILEDFFLRFGIKYNNHDKVTLWLIRYFNFRLKYIVLNQREVKVSKGLTEKISTHPNCNVLSDIFNKAAQGDDLNPYQSKASFNADYPDLLFNDWGIHHLHLRSDKENPSDYFNGRTGLLLFVKFTIDTAYFLDIKSHDDWSNTDFIRIIQRNWPEIIADREIPNTQWSPNFNDEKIGILRKKGYLFGINVDEKAYLILGHGRTSSGDNAMAIRLANEVWRWVGENKHLFDTNLDTFKLGLNEQLHI